MHGIVLDRTTARHRRRVTAITCLQLRIMLPLNTNKLPIRHIFSRSSNAYLICKLRQLTDISLTLHSTEDHSSEVLAFCTWLVWFVVVVLSWRLCISRSCGSIRNSWDNHNNTKHNKPISIIKGQYCICADTLFRMVILLNRCKVHLCLAVQWTPRTEMSAHMHSVPI